MRGVAEDEYSAPGVGPLAGADVTAVQRRTIRTLVGAQILGGTGVGATVAVAALLAEELSGSATLAGFAPTMMTLGAGLLALPLARIATTRSRRAALGTGWAIGALGGAVVIIAAVLGQFPLLLLGMVLIGAGNAANLQSRYAATDLAPAAKRARALSVVVWATTVGAVLGPNLIRPGSGLSSALGMPAFTGSILFTAVAFTLGALVVWITLRPDPLVVARRTQSPPGTTASPTLPPGRHRGLRTGIRAVRASPDARLGLVAIAIAHTVMVGVMTMTPVHMRHAGASIGIVGLTISLHVAGMYALSPLSGMLADRAGRVPAIVAGQVLLAVAVVVAGTSGGSMLQVSIGLFLLGLGWSATVVAGSTLLAESVPLAVRPSAQGLSDLTMNLLGATGSALSGAALALMGYAGLNLAAGLLVVPILAPALIWRVRRRSRATYNTPNSR